MSDEQPIGSRELPSQMNAFSRIIRAEVALREGEARLKDVLTQVQAREREKAALLAGASKILEGKPFAETARGIFDYCREATGATSGYVALLSADGEENEVLFLESGGRPCTVDPKLPMPVRGLRAEAYKTGHAVYENGFAHSEWAKFMPPGHVRLDNALFAPLNIQGKTVGLIGLANKPGGFTPEDAAVATAFGELAAIALRNSRDLDALRTSEQRFRTIFEEAPLGVALIDSLTGQIYQVNPRFAEIAGRTQAEMATMDWMSITHPDDEQEDLDNMALLNAGKISGFNMNKRYRRPNGSYVWIDMTIAPITVDDKSAPRHLCMIQDITERKRLEEEKALLEAQNRQLQKAESLGRVAKAVSHNFNNQLQAVVGQLELALTKLPRDAAPVENLNAAMKSVLKAAELSDMARTYVGFPSNRRELLDLSDICIRGLPLLKAAKPENVDLETSLHPGSVLSMDADQMQQVLTNLITNAWEAIGEGQGTVRLTVKTVPPAEIPAAHRFPINWQPHDSSYACMEVADTGCGIAHQNLEKLFDPFFSTKFIGRGMGLPVVLGILRTHHGAITVESIEGSGSTFRVFLPVSAEDVKRQAEPVAQTAAIGGTGTVLLVEDEEVVRDMAAAMLAHLGYTVLKAQDGIEALEMFRQHQAEIRCVLCDVSMPRLDGWGTLSALRKLTPAIPVILASGYDESEVIAGEHPERPTALIKKPYRIKLLSEALGRAFGSP